MPRAYRKKTGPRFPSATDSVQLNCCRNPLCPTFGVHPIEGASRWTGPDHPDAYIAIGTSAASKGKSSLQCRQCKETVALISNAAIVEERDRLLAWYRPIPSGACRTEGCKNQGRDIAEAPEAYQRFGRTEAGSSRYRCRACRRTFSSTRSVTHRLRRPEKTLEIYLYLMNRVAMRRLCEIADIGAATLYQRIELIHERCRVFAAFHERPLLAGKPLGDVHIATDRQEHTLNWASALDRRQSVLMATASAEGKSGYILAQHVNFDPDADPFTFDLAARDAGDPDLHVGFRRFARLWLPYERLDASLPSDQETELTTREDFRPASRGTPVHESIAMAAHFQVLRRLLSGADHIQFSLDREPGIERTCLLTFADRVRNGSLDAFLVRINKHLTVNAKRAALWESEAALARERTQLPGRSEVEVLFAMLAARYRTAVQATARPRDRWVAHPYPAINEPERASVCLTDDGQRPMDRLLQGYARASLRSIDRYFMQVRRKIHLLERPIHSSSAVGRAFYGYNAYSALVVIRLLDIFRVTYNFHLTGKQKTTPAQRWGLTDRAWSLEDILAFEGG